MSNTESKRKILVIEPDDDIRQMLNIYFSGLGYHVTTVTDGTSALSILLSSNLPDVILLAEIIPDANSFDLCRKIHQANSVGFTPVIMLCISDSHFSKMSDIERGVNDFIINHLILNS